MKLKIIPALILIATVGCVSLMGGNRGFHADSKYKVLHDEFTGHTMRVANLYTPSYSTLTEASLSFIAFTDEEGETYYAARTYIYREDWLFIEKLMLKIDGRIREFGADDQDRNVLMGAYIEELNTYQITRQDMVDFYEEGDMRFRIVGNKGSLDLEVDRDDLEYLKRLIDSTALD